MVTVSRTINTNYSGTARTMTPVTDRTSVPAPTVSQSCSTLDSKVISAMRALVLTELDSVTECDGTEDFTEADGDVLSFESSSASDTVSETVTTARAGRLISVVKSTTANSILESTTTPGLSIERSSVCDTEISVVTGAPVANSVDNTFSITGTVVTDADELTSGTDLTAVGVLDTVTNLFGGRLLKETTCTYIETMVMP